MQNSFRFIHSLHGKGISVLLVGDLLKVEPKALLTDEIRTEIKKRKVKLIEALSRVEPAVLGEGNQALRASCWHCLYYDGAGSSWPGMCRFFEQIGQEAKEIDFKVVDPDKGCRFFQAESFFFRERFGDTDAWRDQGEHLPSFALLG